MHDLKSLRKNLEEYKNKLQERNFNLDTKEFTKIDKLNRELINQKELLEQEKKKLSKSKDQKNFNKSKEISVKIDEKKIILNLNVNINSNFIDQEFPKIANTIEVNLLENKDNFNEEEWNNLYKLSVETFVEESDSLKEGAAGAGLTDND